MKTVVIDIETNALHNPSKIWVVVCKDIKTNKLEIFRNLTESIEERERFNFYAKSVDHWVGHNIIEFDFPVLIKLINFYGIPVNITDTLILSRLIDYSRAGGHSLDSWGKEVGLDKMKFSEFTRWSQEMEDYCIRDVEVCLLAYNKLRVHKFYASLGEALPTEQRFQLIVNDLQNNGFAYDREEATKLLTSVLEKLQDLDNKIREAFPPKQIVVREFIPKATKFGTISKTSVPRSMWDRMHEFEVGVPFPLVAYQSFNPASHKQLIEVLNAAGWRPENKTDSHKECEREITRLQRSGDSDNLAKVKAKLIKFKNSGWKIDETNLATLPPEAPEPTRHLAQRILYEARRRSLVEQINCISGDGRIHGKFIGIGAWTHRMAHRQPNTANIPREFKEDGSLKFMGKELRSLWIAPKDRLLVGVDAEGIQLRIFAHLIDDPDFIKALAEGSKKDKTDPHSLNQRILGKVCKTRQAAKRFVYALLLGGGMQKLAAILECSESEAKEALERLMEKYQGWAYLKEKVFPKDAKNGYFVGLDGRMVSLPGTSISENRHLLMSGYLQNGEALIMKKAAIIVDDSLTREKELKLWLFVNLVHDELQEETAEDQELALRIAKINADAIVQAGEELKLKCPLAGSYFNEDNQKYTFGKTWYDTH